MQYSHYSSIQPPSTPPLADFRLRLIILTHKCEYDRVIVLPWRAVDDETSNASETSTWISVYIFLLKTTSWLDDTKWMLQKELKGLLCYFHYETLLITFPPSLIRVLNKQIAQELFRQLYFIVTFTIEV